MAREKLDDSSKADGRDDGNRREESIKHRLNVPAFLCPEVAPDGATNLKPFLIA